jgi:glycosyltransferase involved in cell wall biosynthesis
MALERFDLSEYDLIISSESGPAKGVLTRSDAIHVCYCHTPMRYLWDMYQDYLARCGVIKRLVFGFLALRLRIWDLATASRVDHFVANSRHVAKRIAKHYRREATVIHPPVSTNDFIIDIPEDYYLLLGQLVAYKQPELAVRAFNRLGKKLLVIGEGEELTKLQSIAKSNVEFLGHQPFEVVRQHLSRCRALIFPGEEDFGITPVEAQASGRPVIAFARGGALETVIENVTGVFFSQPEVESLIEAVVCFESRLDEFDPKVIRSHSMRFGSEHFKAQFKAYVDARLAERSSLGDEA